MNLRSSVKRMQGLSIRDTSKGGVNVTPIRSRTTTAAPRTPLHHIMPSITDLKIKKETLKRKRLPSVVRSVFNKDIFYRCSASNDQTTVIPKSPLPKRVRELQSSTFNEEKTVIRRRKRQR